MRCNSSVCLHVVRFALPRFTAHRLDCAARPYRLKSVSPPVSIHPSSTSFLLNDGATVGMGRVSGVTEWVTPPFLPSRITELYA